jgi:TPP-dependent pyruvate/acetoin dehydrogenase alpha subunit
MGSDSAGGVVDLVPTKELLDMYRQMLRIRTFEEQVERLHRRGALEGPFHSSAGQEAVAVGVCAVLRRDDVITSTHRGHGHVLAKGAKMDRMLAELAGRATGYCHGRGGSMHLADINVGAIGEDGVIGGSMFLATGAGLGFQLESSDRVAVAFFGDGAVGQGVFHECLNLAAIWTLPVVFVCENNLYAHSYPSTALSNRGDVAGRAASYGLPGVRVDGTDVVHVRSVAEGAVRRARRGEGATLIEATCYRFRGHNLGDAEHLYRSREELKEAMVRDPLVVLRRYLKDAVDSSELEAIERIVTQEFEESWEFAEGSPVPERTALYEDVPA